MLTTLCLAALGGLIFDRLAARVGKYRLAAAIVVSLAVLADGWVTDFPLAKTPEPWSVESCAGPGALMELPLGDPFRDVAAMYRNMSYGRAVVNGYSGYFPPHYAALRFGLGLRDDDVLTQLASHGITDVVVDTSRDADGWSRYLLTHPGTQTVCSQEGRTLYRLQSSSPPTNIQSSSKPLKIAALHANVNEGNEKYMLDGDRTTRWESGPQSDRTVLDVDLGIEQRVSAIQLLQGPFVEDFPRMLSVEVLGADAQWNQIYRGGTAGRAFMGAFESPKDVALTFPFPVGLMARYIRLRTLANDETYYWSIAELKVWGP